MLYKSLIPKEAAMKKSFLVTLPLIFVAALVLTKGAWATDFPDITVQDLKGKMDRGEKIFVLNPLSDIEHSIFHIPGSVNVPLMELTKPTDKLPQDKETPIVCY
jgi:hypothetical protein